MAITGRGSSPITSSWFRRKFKGSLSPIAKAVYAGDKTSVEVSVFTDWFFEAPAGGSVVSNASPSAIAINAAAAASLRTSKALPASIAISAFATTAIISSVAQSSGITITAFDATDTVSSSGSPVYPSPPDVRSGVTYGPTGSDFTGTLNPSGISRSRCVNA